MLFWHHIFPKNVFFWDCKLYFTKTLNDRTCNSAWWFEFFGIFWQCYDRIIGLFMGISIIQMMMSSFGSSIFRDSHRFSKSSIGFFECVVVMLQIEWGISRPQGPSRRSIKADCWSCWLGDPGAQQRTIRPSRGPSLASGLWPLEYRTHKYS